MPDMPQRQIRVVFKKQVSDGNYGSESAEVTLEEWDDDAKGDDGALAEELLANARNLVHAELARSPNPRVRAALQLPLPTAEAIDDRPF